VNILSLCVLAYSLRCGHQAAGAGDMWLALFEMHCRRRTGGAVYTIVQKHERRRKENDPDASGVCAAITAALLQVAEFQPQ